MLANGAVAATPGANDGKTTMPIKHVIIIVGENRTFDHLFATYVPPKGKSSVKNLLSEGIIDKNGNPGPSFASAAQYSASVTVTYNIAPSSKQLYRHLPPIMTDSAPEAQSETAPPFYPFIIKIFGMSFDYGIADLTLLTTGATGLPAKIGRHAPPECDGANQRAVPAFAGAYHLRTRIRRARRTAFTRCGSSSTARQR